MRADLAVKRAKAIFGDRLDEVHSRVLAGEIRQEEPASPGGGTTTDEPPAGAGRARTRAIPGAAPGATAMARDPRAAESAQATQSELVSHGARALAKISAGRESEITPTEALGLEAIVLIQGRPALLIQDGKFFPPPTDWANLDTYRVGIQRTFSRVGRIEVQNHPELEWLGTGFLVGPTAIMTNRHVAVEFARRAASVWKFITPMSARIDFKEEFGGLASDEHAITGIIGVHEKLDLALLSIEWTDAAGAPQPLPIAGKAPATIAQMKGLKVYVVGYPAWDGRRNDPEAMRKIFTNIFEVKRLQPGEITGVSAYVEGHDCSTLGGNSGSAVFGLESQVVLGLHYGGKFQVGNTAVPLWMLAKDPLLKKAKVNFV